MGNCSRGDRDTLSRQVSSIEYHNIASQTDDIHENISKHYIQDKWIPTT